MPKFVSLDPRFPVPKRPQPLHPVPVSNPKPPKR